MSQSRRIAVIGGGISGLAAAHRLAASGHGGSVMLLEASARLGGKILTEHTDDFTIEGGPDAFLATKPRGVGVSEELRIDDQFVVPDQRQRGSFILRNGKLHRLPEGLTGLVPTKLKPMVETRLISPVGKARMALDFVLPARKGREDESLASFLTRRLGNEAVANLIEPLMAGIYAGDATKLSLDATFPQLRAAERDHGGLIKGVIATRRAAEAKASSTATGTPSRTGFISYRDGMGTLIAALADRIRSLGATIELNAAVTAIARHGLGYVLTIDRGGTISNLEVDGVVIATPAWIAGPLLAAIDPDAGAAMSEIPHVSTALIALAFDVNVLPAPDTLHGFGYVVPRRENRDVMAMTWLSSKWEGRTPAGKILVRGFVGRAGQEAVYAKSDDALIATVRQELREILGIDGTPILTRVYRWDRGMPQYNLGHTERIGRIDAGQKRLPGLAIAGNMFRGVGIPDCIRSGEDAADVVLAGIATPTPTLNVASTS